MLFEMCVSSNGDSLVCDVPVKRIPFGSTSLHTVWTGEDGVFVSEVALLHNVYLSRPAFLIDIFLSRDTLLTKGALLMDGALVNGAFLSVEGMSV